MCHLKRGSSVTVTENHITIDSAYEKSHNRQFVQNSRKDGHGRTDGQRARHNTTRLRT